MQEKSDLDHYHAVGSGVIWVHQIIWTNWFSFLPLMLHTAVSRIE